MKCPKCGKKMRYRIFYNFGDPNLGVREEFYECLSCGHRKRVQ